MSIVEARHIDSLSEPFRYNIQYSDSESIDSSDHDHNTIDVAASAHHNANHQALNNAFLDFVPRSMPSSTLSEYIPSLTRGSSFNSSHGTTRTDRLRTVQGEFVLDNDNDNDNGTCNFQPSSDPRSDDDLLCPFQILDCCETFSDVREFKTHVFSHFHGHSLPKSATCFLCSRNFQQTDTQDLAQAWNDMLSHLANDHFRRGQEYGTMRADFALMRWMYDRKIISDHVFKRTQTCPITTVFPAGSRRPSEVNSIIPEAPSPPSGSSVVSTIPESVTWPSRSTYSTQTYVTFAGPRTERRRRDSTRPSYLSMSPNAGWSATRCIRFMTEFFGSWGIDLALLELN